MNFTWAFDRKYSLDIFSVLLLCCSETVTLGSNAAVNIGSFLETCDCTATGLGVLGSNMYTKKIQNNSVGQTMYYTIFSLLIFFKFNFKINIYSFRRDFLYIIY